MPFLNSQTFIGRVFGRSSFLFGDRLLGIASSLFSLVLGARLLEATEFGYFTLNIAVYSLLVPVVVLGLNGVLIPKFISRKHSQRLYLSVFFVRLAVLIILLLLFYLAKSFASNWANLIDEIHYFMFLGLLGICLCAFDPLNQANEKTHLTFLARLFSFSAFLFPKFALLASGRSSVELILQLYFLEIFSYNLMGFIFSSKFSKPLMPTRGRYLTKIVFLGKFHFWSSILEIINLRADQILIASFLGSAVAGSYALGARVSEFPVFVGLVIGAAMFPEIYAARNSPKNQYYLYRKLNQTLLFFGIGSSLFVLILAPNFMPLIFGAGQIKSVFSAQMLSIVAILLFLRVGVSKWILASGNFEFSLISHGLAAFVNIFGNLLLIQRFGLWGAIISSALSYCVSVLCVVIARDGREFLKFGYVSFEKS